MTTPLGWRKVFGVITPTINTVVQPEYDAMRPAGVVNHMEGIYVPDDPVANDADFDELVRRIDVALEDAAMRVMSCKPDHLILGISAESIWDSGDNPGEAVAKRIRAKCGSIGFTQASDALPAALRRYGVKKNIAIITPYFPIAEKPIQSFVKAIGYNLLRTKHLSCKGPVLIAHTTEDQLRSALHEVNGPDVEAIVQFGANLPMAKLAGEAERWLGKPVIAVNTATYWYALRDNKIDDKIQGFGRLLADF